MPLSKEQFLKARKSGFTVDQIVSFEKRRARDSLPIPFNVEGKDLKQIISEGWEKYKNLPVIKQGDELVENVSKFIEPNIVDMGDGKTRWDVPEGRSAAGMVVNELPRQMAAEFIRSYKPSTLIAFLGASKLVKPIAKPLTKFVGAKIPAKMKKFLLQKVTVGKGLPDKYLQIVRKAKLEKAAGAREAEDVARVLSIAKEDIKIPLKKGGEILIKKGQPITREHQRYVGRIFRNEIDIGGKQKLISDPEISKRMFKNVEVEVGFNKKIQSLNKKLEDINRALKSKKLLAEGMVGKQFRTDTGFIEEVTGVTKTPRTLAGGKFLKKPSIDLITEPINPSIPTSAPIPANIAQSGEDIVRSMGGVSKAKSINKFVNMGRKSLLEQRRAISKQIMKETLKIEEGVRTNYYIFNSKYADQIRSHPKYKQLASIAHEGRSIMDKWSRLLADSGIPKEQAKETIEKNIGEYMARMFENDIISGRGVEFSVSPKNLRMRLNGLKHKKDLSATVLKEVEKRRGRIVSEPAIPTAIRVKEISSSLANNRIFNEVASNPEWVASANVTGNMVQLPKTKSLGNLAGKFVVPEIASEINAITSLKAQNLSMEIYSKAMGAWKFGKVVLNPSTHVRNMMSNSMLLDMSGVNHFRQMQLLPKVAQDYLTKGKLYKLALQHGAIGDEFVGAEVGRIKDSYINGTGGNLGRWMNVLKVPFRKAADLYQAEEQLAKMIKFADMLEKGKTPAIAALEAQKWLFNYNEIPEIIKVAKHAAPFITFTYKSIPRVAETLINNPLKIYKYYAMANAINESSRKMLGMTPVEFAKEQNALPPWLMRSIGGMPTTLMMPWKDKYGRTQWLNLEYIIPLGMAPEISRKGILKGGISNPLYNIISDLSKNKDFKGQDIVPIASTPAEAAKITTEYIYRQLAPSLAPSLFGLEGGYSFEKVMSALQKRPDYADRVREITPVLFDVLAGLKITPIDSNESEMFKMYEKKRTIEELNNQFIKLQHPAISEKERQKQSENIFKKIQKVLEK